MELEVENLKSNERMFLLAAEFEPKLDKRIWRQIEEQGFGNGVTFSLNAFAWTWSQWLHGRPRSAFEERLTMVVRRGMELRDRSEVFRNRPLHELLLLHCASALQSPDLLKEVASSTLDSDGFGDPPLDDGSRFICSWVGAIKHWVLGKLESANTEANIMWESNPPRSLRRPPKKLFQTWLEKDWNSFRKNQKADFKKLWSDATRDRVVKKKTTKKTTVDFDQIGSLKQQWCWGHCGLALMAHQLGEGCETDEFWFPSIALK